MLAALIVNCLLSAASLAAVVKLSFKAGQLVQKVEDIDRKGCQHRRNGGCN